MLANPRRSQENPLSFLLRPGAFAGASRDLPPEGILQSGGSELFLAEKIKLAAIFKTEEVVQAVLAYALGASGTNADFRAGCSAQSCRVIAAAAGR